MSNLHRDHYSISLYRQRDFAGQYEGDRFGNRFGEFLKKEECAAFAGFLSSFDRVLDVGTGTGKLAVHLSDRGQVVASDASLEMLLIARSTAQESAKNIAFVVCDAHFLCFRDRAFDAVISSRVLMHLTNWKRCVTELCRVSAKSVVIDFPHLCSFTAVERIYRRIKRAMCESVQTYRSFSIRTVVREFEKSGFSALRAERLFSLPIFIHRRINIPTMTTKLERVLRRVGLTKIFGSPVMLRVDRQIRGGIG
jgi:ubiquinone/menaquinone biosynthesis C-methylase UbiE